MNILRTFLFAPGNVRRKAEKSFLCGADAVILDLEDAVATSEKAAAREIVRNILAGKKEINTYVRVNAISTGLTWDDLEEVVSPNISGVVLPKVESPEEIKYLEWRLQEIEDKMNLANNIEITPFIETATGLCGLKEILSSSSRISRLFFGAVDFITDIGAIRTQAGYELLYARSKLVVESKAAGIEPPVDTVYTDIKDLEGLRTDARLARQMGFQGKLVIHPNQVEIVNEVFSPTSAEIEWAQKVVGVFEKSEAGGNAAIQVDGKFVEYPIYERAKKTLDTYNSILSRNRGLTGSK